MFRKATILGGGPAGLAAAYYLKRARFDVHVLEAANETGGNCRTLEADGFRFDTGAHRFHNKDPEVTREIRKLLGTDGLIDVDCPSRILVDNAWYHFPLRPLEMLCFAGARQALGSAWDLVKLSLRPDAEPRRSFEQYTRGTYGDRIAEQFLLPYSEKLWGLPAERLSPLAATGRLQGLRPLDLLAELIPRRKWTNRHLDGRFCYPPLGYGSITQALTQALGDSTVRCNTRITGFETQGNLITACQLGDRSPEAIDGPVICTLPLSRVAGMLQNHLSPSARQAAAAIRFRAVRLLFLALDRPAVSDDASIYVPAPEIPFTRLHEPRNRSRQMAPAGKTSLVVEFPHFPDDEVAGIPTEELATSTMQILQSLELVSPSELMFTRSLTLANAYPVMEIGFEAHRQLLLSELGQFANLEFLGRIGQFAYTHLHDIMREARQLALEIEREQTRADRPA